ncbi:hypothetical protein KI387_030345, partial [Taxus chinensis]
MIQTFGYFSTKPPVNETLQIMKHITLGNNAKAKEIMLELFGEVDLEVRLDLERTDEEEMVHTWKEKEKGKLVYMINDDEVDNL